MRKIESLKQLTASTEETYMYAIIVAIIAVALAFCIATMIKWGGGKYDTSHIKRRIWFIIVGIITPICFYLYNSLYVNHYITKAPLQAQFGMSTLWATLALLGTYIIIGVITMFIFRRSKWGSILGQSKK
jgi:hypothetical protein